MIFALIVFILLLIAGIYLEELSWRQVGLLILIAAVAAVGLIYIDPFLNFFTVALVILDLVVAVIVFRSYVGRL